jgi:hypothetical protein
MNACIRDLQAKYDTVVKHLQGHNSATSNDKEFRESDLPLTKEVMELPFLKKFKVPVIDPKDGSKDLANHVETLKTHIALRGGPNQICVGSS